MFLLWAPKLQDAWKSRYIGTLICLIILNQAIGLIFASSVFSWPPKISPLSRSEKHLEVLQQQQQQQQLGTSKLTVSPSSPLGTGSGSDQDGYKDDQTNEIIINKRQPLGLIERIKRVRVARSERMKDFQESFLNKLGNVRNKKKNSLNKNDSVHKLDNTNLPVHGSLANSNDNTLDFLAGEPIEFTNQPSAAANNQLTSSTTGPGHKGQQQDGIGDSESKTSGVQFIGSSAEFNSNEPTINYKSSPMVKFKRALMDVIGGGAKLVGGGGSSSSSSSSPSDTMDFSGLTLTGGGGGSPNHVISHDSYPLLAVQQNSNSNLQSTGQQNTMTPAASVQHQINPAHSRQNPQVSLIGTKIVIPQQNQPSQQNVPLGGHTRQPQVSWNGTHSYSDSVVAETMWPENNNNNFNNNNNDNNRDSSRQPQTFGNFGRRNVKPAAAATRIQPNRLNGQIENFGPENNMPMQTMNDENQFPAGKGSHGFDEYDSSDNLAATLGTSSDQRKKSLKVAESNNRMTKCSEHKEATEEKEDSPKKMEVYEEVEEYHAPPPPVKKIEKHHHHHHHHHHQKVVQKEVKKIQQVQPVHLEIHIKGKSKSGGGKKKEKEQVKAKLKGKAKSKEGEEAHVKFQNGMTEEQDQLSYEEAYKKANDGQDIEDNKSLVGAAESDGGSGQAGEGKRPALASAAPIASVADSSEDGEGSGAGGGGNGGGEAAADASGDGSSQDGGRASSGSENSGQHQGQVDEENSRASSEDQMGHVINTSQVPNHYSFDMHDHSQQHGGGGEQGSGQEEQGQQQQQQQQQQEEEQPQQQQQEQEEQQQQQVAEEEKKTEAETGNGGGNLDRGESNGGADHKHHKKSHKKHKKPEKVQVKQVDVAKKDKHHKQGHKKEVAVVEEEKKVEPVVKHEEPVKEEPKKVVEQPQQHGEQHKQHKKSKHQHLEVHQHKHFELHKHINLHQPEIEQHGQHGQHEQHEQQEQEGGSHEMGHNEHAGFEGHHEGGYQQHPNDGYHPMGHGEAEPLDHYEHQQPMHGEPEEQVHHHGHQVIPEREEWIVPDLHEKMGHGHSPGAIIIEDHSELERHHHQHPMEVGYKEEIVHHPHGFGLTPSAAHGLMGAYSAPTASHSTGNDTTKITGQDTKIGSGTGSLDSRAITSTPL